MESRKDGENKEMKKRDGEEDRKTRERSLMADNQRI